MDCYLFVEDRFGLSSIAWLFPIIPAFPLGCKAIFSFLVLCHLVQGVFSAFFAFAVSLLGLWNIYLPKPENDSYSNKVITKKNCKKNLIMPMSNISLLETGVELQVMFDFKTGKLGGKFWGMVWTWWCNSKLYKYSWKCLHYKICGSSTNKNISTKHTTHKIKISLTCPLVATFLNLKLVGNFR